MIKPKKFKTKEATEAEARALAQMAAAEDAAARAATAALTVATDKKFITMSYAVAAETTEASEVQETKGKDKEILTLIQERKTTAKHEKERIREIRKK